jgi:prepilin-type N-terminal cleavage/methylation domain-containing protein
MIVQIKPEGSAGASPRGAPARPGRGRDGFSLIEALIVLLVAGMALMLVFSIGGGAARTGFQLGRRALAAADGEVAEDELRALVAGLRLAPGGADPQALKLLPLVGDARGFAADAVLARPGLCGPAGPVGRLRVAIESRPDGDEVTCQAGSAPVAVVADLAPRRARFAYSPDGTHWSDRWTSPPPATDPKAEPVEQALYVRLASEDGQVDIVARASSGPPWLYPKPPVKP